MAKINGSIRLFAGETSASYFVAYREEMVSKNRTIKLQFENPIKDIDPNRIESEIRKQLGNVEIISIGRL